MRTYRTIGRARAPGTIAGANALGAAGRETACSLAARHGHTGL